MGRLLPPCMCGQRSLKMEATQSVAGIDHRTFSRALRLASKMLGQGDLLAVSSDGSDIKIIEI